jgi:D-alanyl-D-alanine carboxypeptidase
MFNELIKIFPYGLVALSNAVYTAPPVSPILTVTQESTTVTASWTTVERANGYHLFYAPYPSADSINSINMGAKTNLSVKLWNEAAFYVAVKSYNTDGNSGYSNIESFMLECPPNGNKCDQLKTLVKAWASKAMIPSVMLRVEDSNGVIYSGSAGQKSFHDNRAVTAESYFRAASVGKLFTAVAVLRLVEKGQLNLDDSIGKFIPETLVNRLHQGKSPSMTIRHLLSHTSGLANIDNDPAKNAWLAQHPQQPKKPAALLDFAIKLGPQFEPGRSQLYTSAGYIVLGMVIEAVTGKAYHEIVRRDVLKPLRLDNTFEETHELPASVAPIHSYAGDYDMNLIHPSMEFADGGFVTTTADLTRFGKALARGEPFTDPQTLQLMMEPYGTELIGLGPFVGNTENGDWYFYHPGHWGVMLFVVPNKQLAIAFTINQSEADYSQFLDKILEIVLN